MGLADNDIYMYTFASASCRCNIDLCVDTLLPGCLPSRFYAVSLVYQHTWMLFMTDWHIQIKLNQKRPSVTCITLPLLPSLIGWLCTRLTKIHLLSSLPYVNINAKTIHEKIINSGLGYRLYLKTGLSNLVGDKLMIFNPVYMCEK